ncbi:MULTISPECIES: DUF5131 family protein [unclassified Arthrobacter]|uniref:DUF5131 family protein n=1 Tax=unclassified Arthrobacter TaxID=235627 RepID=UPI0027D80309|nr:MULTISPECIES: DUF5131 family protein [unclassified Arthrobacter]
MARIADQLSWPSSLWMGVPVEDADVMDRIDHLRVTPAAARFLSCEPLLGSLANLNLAGIDWVIAGGESGPNYRPRESAWVEDIRDQCAVYMYRSSSNSGADELQSNMAGPWLAERGINAKGRLINRPAKTQPYERRLIGPHLAAPAVVEPQRLARLGPRRSHTSKSARPVRF